jgi:hypothetical protein
VRGTQVVGPLNNDVDFTLDCSGAGGTVGMSVNVVVNQPQPPPTVSLSAMELSIDSGQATTLSWTSVNADSCAATDAWGGTRPQTGSGSTGSLSATSTFVLTCTGPGGSGNDSVTVTVIQPAPAPTLTFSASETIVNPGSSVSLSWTSTDTTSCAASGGWGGNKAMNGSELVGPINVNTTFTLSCSGPGGNLVEMLTVSTLSPVSLNWVAPTENVDGSSLTDLAGYRIYYGIDSRDYGDMVELIDPAATGHTLTLVSGDYYLAMTALDLEGNESAYSNEVLKTSL